MAIQKTSPQPLRWLAVFLLASSSAFIISGIVDSYSSCARLVMEGSDQFGQLTFVAAQATFSVVGWLIIFYRPQNRIGWLCLVIGFSGTMTEAINSRLICFSVLDSLPARFVFIAWLNYAALTFIGLLSMFMVLPWIFPNGQFVSKAWRNLFWSLLAIATAAQIIGSLTPDLREPNFATVTFAADNPFAAVPLAWAAAANNLVNLMLILGSILGFVSMIVRFRRSRGDERQQLKWFTYFFGVVGGSYVFFLQLIGARYFRSHPELIGTPIHEIANAVVMIGTVILFAGIPLIIGITVFKYRLYDIDIIIRRTLQYAIVTGILALTYFGGIVILQGILGPLTGEFNSPVVTVITTLAIAGLFNPLRIRVQDFIDRRFYRRKYDAEQTLARFAATARDEVDMEKLTTALLDVVKETMQPEKVSLWIK